MESLEPTHVAFDVTTGVSIEMDLIYVPVSEWLPEIPRHSSMQVFELASNPPCEFCHKTPIQWTTIAATKDHNEVFSVLVCGACTHCKRINSIRDVIGGPGLSALCTPSR